MVNSSLDFRLGCKLRLLKGKLKEWSRENFGEQINRKNSLLSELTELDLAQETRGLTDEEPMIRATIMVELEVMAKNEEASWR